MKNEKKDVEMKKCALVIGHKKNSAGASNEASGIDEFTYNDALALEIEAQIEDIEVQRIYRRTYETLPSDINGYDPDFIISLHCNAFNTQASGTETLYYHKSTRSKEIAEILNTKIVGALGLKDRGIKAKSVEDRGGYLLKYTNAPCVIAEPFFIDNEDDFTTANVNRKMLVEAYVESIKEIANIV